MSRSNKNLDHYKKKGKKSQSSSSSSSDEDGYAGSWSSSSSEGSSSSSQESYDEQPLRSQKKGTGSKAAPLSDATELAHQTAEYHFEYHTKPSDRFNSKAHLKHGGEVELSLANGHLKTGYVKKKTHFERDGAAARPREIIKAIRVKRMTVDGWDRGLVISFPTVPVYKEEEYNNRGHVCKRLAPKELNSHTPQDFTVMERKITNASIEFQLDHPDLDPQNFDAHYQKLEKFGMVLVPMDSPIIDHYNADPVNKKSLIKSASKGWEKEKLRKMAQTDVDKYGELAKKQMSDKISYGDVTNKFAIRLNAPMPANREKDHKLFKEGGKQGIEFQGLADFGYACPGANPNEVQQNGKTALENFREKAQCFSGVIEVDYYVVNDVKK